VDFPRIPGNRLRTATVKIPVKQFKISANPFPARYHLSQIMKRISDTESLRAPAPASAIELIAVVAAHLSVENRCRDERDLGDGLRAESLLAPKPGVIIRIQVSEPQRETVGRSVQIRLAKPREQLARREQDNPALPAQRRFARRIYKILTQTI